MNNLNMDDISAWLEKENDNNKSELFSEEDPIFKNVVY